MLDFTLLQLKVLWLINKDKYCGYGIMKKLSSKNKKLTQGTLYPLLKKFENSNFLTMKKEGDRGKKYYALTQKGRKILDYSCERFCKFYREIFKEYVCESCRSSKKGD